jgi:hypothetical protein
MLSRIANLEKLFAKAYVLLSKDDRKKLLEESSEFQQAEPKEKSKNV